MMFDFGQGVGTEATQLSHPIPHHRPRCSVAYCHLNELINQGFRIEQACLVLFENGEGLGSAVRGYGWVLVDKVTVRNSAVCRLVQRLLVCVDSKAVVVKIC